MHLSIICHTSLTTGSSICVYNFVRLISTSCDDVSLQSTSRDIRFLWKFMANERIVLVSFVCGISKFKDSTSPAALISNVTRCCLRSKKNDILCFKVGKSIINKASIEMCSLRRGLWKLKINEFIFFYAIWNRSRMVFKIFQISKLPTSTAYTFPRFQQQ